MCGRSIISENRAWITKGSRHKKTFASTSGEDRSGPKSALGKGSRERWRTRESSSYTWQRTLSAAVRRKIAAAQRARWALVKAAKKTA
jgi:hypothetical protein